MLYRTQWWLLKSYYDPSFGLDLPWSTLRRAFVCFTNDALLMQILTSHFIGFFYFALIFRGLVIEPQLIHRWQVALKSFHYIADQR